MFEPEVPVDFSSEGPRGVQTHRAKPTGRDVGNGLPEKIPILMFFRNSIQFVSDLNIEAKGPGLAVSWRWWSLFFVLRLPDTVSASSSRTKVPQLDIFLRFVTRTQLSAIN